MSRLASCLLLIVVLLAGCGWPGGQASPSSTPFSTGTADLSGAEPGYSTCHYVYPVEAQGLPNRSELVLPDPRCTPGAYDGETQAQACAAHGARPDLSQLKLTLLVRYGQAKTRILAQKVKGNYELDHFGPRWAGGLDSEANLWPQPHASPNAKDGLELHLHDQVCRHGYSLEQARKDVLGNWVAVWLQMGRPTAPATLAD